MERTIFSQKIYLNILFHKYTELDFIFILWMGSATLAPVRLHGADVEAWTQWRWRKNNPH